MILGIIDLRYLRKLSNNVLWVCSGGSEEVLHVVVAAAVQHWELVDGEGSRSDAGKWELYVHSGKRELGTADPPAMEES